MLASTVASATLLKLQTLEKAMMRSTFFARHVFLRTTILLVFDAAARKNGVELKIMNFMSSYAVPESAIMTHEGEWDGTAECHEDGYLTGLRSLLRVVEGVVARLEAAKGVEEELKEGSGNGRRSSNDGLKRMLTRD